jgi:hypothetical protein
METFLSLCVVFIDIVDGGELYEYVPLSVCFDGPAPERVS